MELTVDNVLEWFAACLVSKEQKWVKLENLKQSYMKYYDLTKIDETLFLKLLENSLDDKSNLIRKQQKGKRCHVLRGFVLKKDGKMKSNIEERKEKKETEVNQKLGIKDVLCHVSVITHSKLFETSISKSDKSDLSHTEPNIEFDSDITNNLDDLQNHSQEITSKNNASTESKDNFIDSDLMMASLEKNSQEDFKTSSPVEKNVLDVEFLEPPKTGSKAKKTLLQYLNPARKSCIEKRDFDYSHKQFKFRDESKESIYYNNLVFSRHFENFKGATSLNLPSTYDSFETLLEETYKVLHTQSEEVKRLIIKAKHANNPIEQRLKGVLCSSFTPVQVGNVAASFFKSLVEGDLLPQFTVVNEQGKNNALFKCELCELYNKFLVSLGKKTTELGTKDLSGFRQVYEHAITNHHKKVLNWVTEIKAGNLKSGSQKTEKIDPILTEFFSETSSKKLKKHPCYHIWDKDLVNRYRDNTTIYTKKTTTLFREKKLWKKCESLKDHRNCSNFAQWKMIHSDEHKELCRESENSSRVVFIPGKTTTPIDSDGSLKSLDPPCLLFSQSDGKHPFTCINCESHKSYLQDLMAIGIEKAALLTSEPRIGRQGFKHGCATKSERQEHLKKIEIENKDLKKTIKKMQSRSNFETKSWELMLLQSCDDNDLTKLAVDMVSLFQQPDEKSSIQYQVCKNLIGKLKSKNNHKFCDIVKDIASNLINNLGQVNYSLFQKIFGLPGKTCAKAHVKMNKLKLGFNFNTFESAEILYEEGPVIDSTDEARLLRFISPVLNDNGKIELIGQSYNADCAEWVNSSVLLEDILSSKFEDEYSALKSYVDSVIHDNMLSKAVAVHNLSALSGIYSKPIVYLVWPTPNKGYKGKHLLKVWDLVRKNCFLDENSNLKISPIKLIGHATDSAGFQLAASVALMTPNTELLKLGVKYLTLGIGATKFAAPYFGPLPSIAYLDYDHCLRLFLKCLKYTTLDLDFFPGTNSSCRASIEHLKELKIICNGSGQQLGFSNNDLLFSAYFDQNVDSALKIFKESVADLLDLHIDASKGTALYIRSVIALFKPFLEPSSDPIEMQMSASKGITILRIWKKILHLKGKRIHAVKNAATDSSKRGRFLTYGCYQTAEILFSAVTYHMLTMFAHFKELSPSVLSPFKSGTKTTERLISDLQGKTNALQSLDAQPVLSDLIEKLSKIQSNHLTEDRLKAAGVTKQNTTNRRRLNDKLAQVTLGTYKYPESFDKFRKSLISAHKKGEKMGIETYRRLCPEGIAFIESNDKVKNFRFLYCDEKVPEKNQFKGFIDEEYSLKMLKDIEPSKYLSETTTKKEKKISEYFVSSKDEKGFELLDEREKQEKLEELEKKDPIIEKSKEVKKNQKGLLNSDHETMAKKPDSDKWYITRLEGNKIIKIHLLTALKALTPREHVSRDRARRHIASNFLPGRAEISRDHNIIAYRFVIANVSNKITVCKIASIMKNGSSLPSASSDDDTVRCRLIPLKETSEGSFTFEFPEALVVTSELKANHILEEVVMKQVEENNGKKLLQILPQFKTRLTDHRNELKNSKDLAFAKEVSKSLTPLEYLEVDEIIERKLDPKSQEYLYHCKFKNSELTAWLNYSCFDRPVHYNRRTGLTQPLFADLSKANEDEAGKGKKRQTSIDTLLSKKVKVSEQNELCKTIPKKTKLKGPISSFSFSSLSSRKEKKGLKRHVSLESEVKVYTGHQTHETIDMTRSPPKKRRTSIVEMPSSVNDTWLSDETVKKACELIRQQFPLLKGLQDPLFGAKISMLSRKNNFQAVSVSDETIQVHHVKGNHWVLSTSSKGNVFVYDSLYCQADSHLKRQLCQIYHHFIEDGYLHVTFPKLLKQKGNSDCGLFCLAYAIDIASGVKPDDECYLQDKFRRHLQICLDSNQIERFPRDNIDNEGAIFKDESVVDIPVFCDCLLPASGEMIKCYYCNQQYHLACLKSIAEIESTEEAEEGYFECHNFKKFLKFED